MFEQIKLVNHIQTAVHDHPSCLWSVGCQIVSVLAFLTGVFAQFKRGYVKRYPRLNCVFCMNFVYIKEKTWRKPIYVVSVQ